MDADPKTAEPVTPEVLDTGAPGPDGAGEDDGGRATSRSRDRRS